MVEELAALLEVLVDGENGRVGLEEVTFPLFVEGREFRWGMGSEIARIPYLAFRTPTYCVPGGILARRTLASVNAQSIVQAPSVCCCFKVLLVKPNPPSAKTSQQSFPLRGCTSPRSGLTRLFGPTSPYRDP